MVRSSDIAFEGMEDAPRPPAWLLYWWAVQRRKILIAAIILAALVLGLVLTLIATPQYTATARVEIARPTGNVTSVEGVSPTSDNRQDLEFYQTQYALLEAETLAQRVARTLNLARGDEFFDAFGVDPDTALVITSNRASEAERRVRLASEVLLRNVRIEPIHGSSLVDIHFESPNALLSAQVANTWTQQFMESSTDRRFASTADARSFLESRLEELRNQLQDSERALVNYAADKQIISLSQTENLEGRTRTEKTLASVNLEALNEELAKATAARIQAQSEAQQQRRGVSDNALQNNAINSLRQTRAELQAQYARMMVQFEPGYPAAEALKSQIDNISRSIVQEEGRVVGSTQDSFAQAAQRENELNGRVDQLRDRLLREQRDTIQYNIYQREVDTNRQLYESLLQKYKEIGVAGVAVSNISIVDTAEVPKKPSSPNLPLNVALALFAGIGLSGATVFAMEQIDQTVRDGSGVTSLGLSLLGTVPDLEKGEMLAELRDPQSHVTEAYLTIQASLSFLTDHGTPRAMMFTSSREEEGKSTSALAMAMLLTRLGRRVLLIDGDLRSPCVAGLFGYANTQGLSNWLAGHDQWRDLIISAKDGIPAVLPSGPQPPNPAELLAGSRLSLLIGELGEDYDHVIVDSPPVLGLADAPLIARAVEGVVYVIQTKRVKMRGIEQALGRLRSSNAHIFGAIVTRLDDNALEYGYGYGYGYGKGGAASD